MKHDFLLSYQIAILKEEEANQKQDWANSSEDIS